MSNNCFIYHHRKTQGNVEHRVDVTAHKINNELNITSSKVVINNGDMFDCNYTSIDLPHDGAIRLRDYLNAAYPADSIVTSQACDIEQ